VGAYRFLLRAYPAAFREPFGDLLEATFRDGATSAFRRRRYLGLLRFWLRVLVDLSVSAIREHAEARRGSRQANVLADSDLIRVRGGKGMTTLSQDIRWAVRGLTRRPGFVAIAVFTLALGIGANVTMFSVVDRVLLSSLPYPESEKVVRIYAANIGTGLRDGNVSPVDVVDWRAQSSSFEAIAMGSGGFMSLTGDSEPVVVWTARWSSSLFDVLRVGPALGRLYGPAEEVIGEHRVVVLTHGFWQSRFGGDPGVIGRRLILQGEEHEVIGVLPADYEDPDPGPFGQASLLLPLAIDLSPEARGGHWLLSYGRLAAGATLRSAQTEMDAIMVGLERAYPETNTGQRVRLVTLRESIAGEARRPLAVLFGAVALLLLIACANVANLLLARAATRGREIAVRRALGAGRGRIIRQLITESVLLSLLAGLLGSALAWSALRVIPRLSAGNLPRVESLSVDPRALLFALLASMATALVFGIVPALHGSRTDMQSTLRDGARGITRGVSGRRLRGALIIVEMSMSMVLLVGAGLLARSLNRLLSVDSGFERWNAVMLAVALPGGRYGEAGARTDFFERFLDRTRALAGVSAAGGVNMLPLTGRYSCDSFALEDRVPPAEGQEPCAESRSATPGYFEAMGMRLIRGRGIGEQDRADSPPAIIINRTMAEQYWPGQDPIGKRFKWGSFTAGTPWREIVGVVEDVKHFGLDRPVLPEVYVPHTQAPASFLFIVARTSGDAATLGSEMRTVLRSLDPDLPVVQMQTLEEIVSQSVAAPRFRTALLGTFAGLAVVLSLVGLYGVLAFTVAQRRQEFGIRLAMGARRHDVLGMVVRQGLAFVFMGLLIGVPAALVTTRVLRSMLFGIEASDPSTFAAVATLLVTVALLASWLPARRATRVDPVTALREE
jgi:putative ABC transport system permease protein